MNNLGLYGPRSQAWRLNREATLLLGAGPRALLMQIAHPLVAEGVAQHSNFREDPWRRLRATLRSYLTIVYGTTTQARAEIGRLKGFAVNPQAPSRAFFKEFVVRLPRPPAEVNKMLRERHGIIGGYDLGGDYPHLAGHMLLAVTEVNTRAAIDRLVGALREIAA